MAEVSASGVGSSAAADPMTEGSVQALRTEGAYMMEQSTSNITLPRATKPRCKGLWLKSVRYQGSTVDLGRQTPRHPGETGTIISTWVRYPQRKVLE